MAEPANGVQGQGKGVLVGEAENSGPLHPHRYGPAFHSLGGRLSLKKKNWPGLK